MNIKEKKLGKSQLELEFELTAEEFEKHVNHALLHLKEHLKMDGFRPGQVPDKIAEEKIGNENLLMEAGDHAVKHVYSDYILENKLEPIGEPDVKIKKIAKGSPFIFVVTATVLPEIELPNYKEIAKKVKGKDIEVTDQEVEDSIKYLQRTRAKLSQKNKEAEKGDFVEIEYQSKDIENDKQMRDQFILAEGGMIKGFEDNVVGMKAGQEKEFNVKFPDLPAQAGNATRKDLAGKDILFKVKMISVQKMELPEINDEFAKQLGAFDTLVALKNSVKEGITTEKTEAEKQRKRGEILDKIAQNSKVEMPEKLVEYEQKRLFEDLKNNITNNFKMTFENYLATVKQTEEGIKETFKKEAEKRIINFLVLREIGKKENIEVSDTEIEEEVSKLIKNYSKEQLDKFDINQFKEYTKGVLVNEKIFQKLESFSQN